MTCLAWFLFLLLFLLFLVSESSRKRQISRIMFTLLVVSFWVWTVYIYLTFKKSYATHQALKHQRVQYISQSGLSAFLETQNRDYHRSRFRSILLFVDNIDQILNGFKVSKIFWYLDLSTEYHYCCKETIPYIVYLRKRKSFI